MRLELSEAISLILALPSHRSDNEGHRVIGTNAIELLTEYKSMGTTDNEKYYNRTMVAIVLSTARAFSVERDRIAGVWKSINQIKKRRERYLDVIRGLSLLEKGNYWSKAILLIIAIGFAVSIPGSVKDYVETVKYGTLILIVLVVGLEIVSKTLEISLSVTFERWLPVQTSKIWQNESIPKYKNLVEKFIEDSICTFQQYFPNEIKLYNFNLTNDEDIEKLKEHFINTKFYF